MIIADAKRYSALSTQHSALSTFNFMTFQHFQLVFE